MIKLENSVVLKNISMTRAKNDGLLYIHNLCLKNCFYIDLC